MHYRYFLLALVVLFVGTAASAVEPADLKPGLVAIYRESTDEEGRTDTTRLEPTVTLSLGAGEMAHPRMPSTNAAHWRGYINITRPGKYTFKATVVGGLLKVKVGNRPVLRADDTGTTEDVVTLEGGVQPFEADFEVDARAGARRVELFWQGPGFVKEPLPHQFLGHLPKDRPKALAWDTELEHGRFLFEELACIKCHRATSTDKMAKGLAERTGPNLTEIAKRAYPGWIDSWLADPVKHRPNTTMPKLFADDDRGKAERYAITKYLVSLTGTTLTPNRVPVNPPNDVKQSFERGRVLYTVTGCAACHDIPKPKPKGEEDDREPLKPEDSIIGLGTAAGAAAKYSLGSLGSKTRPEALAAYLQNPGKTNPAGRMPHMNLSQQEATDVARYLCQKTDEVTEPGMPAAPKMKPVDLGSLVYSDFFGAKARQEVAALEQLTAEKQWVELGRTLTDVKGCLHCHDIEANGKKRMPGPEFTGLADLQKAGAKGCIGEKPDVAKVPVFKLDAKEMAAIAAFLKTGLSGAGSPAPSYAARVALRRFNCLNCHSRDGEGGISTEHANEMRLLSKAENADDVRPPLLTGIGHKTRTPWLKSVLTGGGRARPWMQLRMPQYGEANVGFLPEELAALEGNTADDSILKLPLSNQQIALGKQIVGKSGLGCISCHDIGGVANTGTRGPDLATINQRVRYEWYERWMHQPLRMAPGTRMPQAFVDGKSTLSTVLNGDPKGQAEAMWAYLSLGPGLPLPEGLEPPKGLIIAVKDRPEVLRTFMPEAGSKAIAVGYPGGVNIAFSADQCRLAYSWAGNFLDVSPVWGGRGGASAKLLGPKFWAAPNGHPWGLTTNPNIPPDFLARANNPAFGLPLPLEPARLYDGPQAVNFDGYSLDRDGRPTFRYTLNEGGKDALLKVSETVMPIKASVAAGFTRRFAIEAPGGYQTWLLAGTTNKTPRAIAADGKRLAPKPDDKDFVIPADGSRIVLPGDADRAVALELTDAPKGAEWCLVPKAGGWLAMVRLPQSKDPWKGTFGVALWALPKDDDALLKDLAAK